MPNRHPRQTGPAAWLPAASSQAGVLACTSFRLSVKARLFLPKPSSVRSATASALGSQRREYSAAAASMSSTPTSAEGRQAGLGVAPAWLRFQQAKPGCAATSQPSSKARGQGRRARRLPPLSVAASTTAPSSAALAPCPSAGYTLCAASPTSTARRLQGQPMQGCDMSCRGGRSMGRPRDGAEQAARPARSLHAAAASLREIQQRLRPPVELGAAHNGAAIGDGARRQLGRGALQGGSGRMRYALAPRRPARWLGPWHALGTFAKCSSRAVPFEGGRCRSSEGIGGKGGRRARGMSFTRGCPPTLMASGGRLGMASARYAS